MRTSPTSDAVRVAFIGGCETALVPSQQASNPHPPGRAPLAREGEDPHCIRNARDQVWGGRPGAPATLRERSLYNARKAASDDSQTTVRLWCLTVADEPGYVAGV